jgi:telomere length regulation protein
MEGILTPVSTIYKSPDPITDAFLTEVRATEVTAPKITRNAKKPESPDEALEVLRNEPDYESLILTLQYFTTGAPQFSITSPSPLASQLVHVLVSEILPTYWNVLHASKPGENSGKNGYSKRSTDLKLLLFCLRSVTGLNAILFCLKQLIPKSKEPKKSFSGQSIQDTLTSLLEALSAVLEGNRTVQKISYTIWNVSETTSMQRTLWIEFLGLMSGKILGIAAETEDVIGELSKDIGEKYWISDGRLYSLWLARNIGYWARSSGPNSDNVWTGCAELLSKSFRLGYTGKKSRLGRRI